MARNGKDTNKYNKNKNTCQKKQQTVHSYLTPLFINPKRNDGCAYAYSGGDGQDTSSLVQRPQLNQHQLRPQSFFISFRLYKKRQDKKSYKTDTQQYPQPCWQLNEEFTCQRYSKYCLREITQIACCKLSPGIINNFHQDSFYHIIDYLSRRK